MWEIKGFVANGTAEVILLSGPYSTPGGCRYLTIANMGWELGSDRELCPEDSQGLSLIYYVIDEKGAIAEGYGDWVPQPPGDWMLAIFYIEADARQSGLTEFNWHRPDKDEPYMVFFGDTFEEPDEQCFGACWHLQKGEL